MITPEELEAALKLCEAATPGKWDVNNMRLSSYSQRPIAANQYMADLEFIAAARTLLPKALEQCKVSQIVIDNFSSKITRQQDEMEKLRAENAKLLRVKEAAETIVAGVPIYADYEFHTQLREALKALDEEGK